MQTKTEKIQNTLINELCALAYSLFINDGLERITAINRALVAFEVYEPFIMDQVFFRSLNWNRKA